MVDQALGTVSHWLAWLLALVLSAFAMIEGALRRQMAHLHITGQVQSVILLLLTAMLIVLTIRLLGGVLRVLLTVFLVLLLLHVVMHHGRV